MTIPLFKVFMGSDITLLDRVLRSGYIGEGTEAKQFESAFSKFVGRKVRNVNSGTSALDLAMHMIGIGPGDEVITTPITCTATNSPIVNRKAQIVWADVHPKTGLIDPYDVARKISPKTKAIIGVNWGGLMPDYTHLKSFGIPVIEDAAHGPFYTTRDRGDYIAWSFQAIKFLTTGDGGALYSPDYDRARLLSWYGLDRESSADFRCAQNIQEVGYKYHMNNINAALGIINLPYVNNLVESHNANAQFYDRFIQNDSIVKPVYMDDHPFWLYTLLVQDRDKFIRYMKSAAIDVSQVHARNDKHDAFKANAGSPDLSGVALFDSTQVSIPVGWWLDVEDLEYVVETVNRYDASVSL